MKLLVTGGAGFIGSEFVRQAVKRSYSVAVIDKLIYAGDLERLMPVYGDGSNVREWLFVEDCAEAIFTTLENGKPGEIYNVGSGIEKTVKWYLKNKAWIEAKLRQLKKYWKKVYK